MELHESKTISYQDLRPSPPHLDPIRLHMFPRNRKQLIPFNFS